MRIILIVLILAFVTRINAQLIPAENTVWQYGNGNDDIVLIFGGNWKSNSNTSNYELFSSQIIKTTEPGIKVTPDSAHYWGNILFQEFQYTPYYDCFRSYVNVENYAGVAWIKDIPSGNYSITLKSKVINYLKTSVFSIAGKDSITINNSTQHIYINQLIYIQ